ncbi:MAG: V-type ATP synthase subunit K [Candidatus Riflebacteria bacterium]|nr:V-type ATP synthase subunit K [Candidatus Riflebacteria bacterium]
MEPSTMLFLGKLSLGLVMGFGGLGSALGVLAAGQAAAGAWAKQGKEGKSLGSYTIMIGMPLSQTLYCLVLYFAMLNSATQPENGPILLGVSLGVGFCQFISAYAQGKIGAAGIRCLAENEDKGRGGIITAMGIAETVALIALAVGILLLNSDIMVKAITATAPAVG